MVKNKGDTTITRGENDDLEMDEYRYKSYRPSKPNNRNKTRKKRIG